MNVRLIIGFLIGLVFGVCLTIIGIGPAKAEVNLTGAGSSFAAPLYSTWAKEFKDEGKGTVNYQSIGSGGGIKAIEAGTVDFGATDMPLTSKELQDNHLLQFPTAVGAVVIVVNLPGEYKHLSLSRNNLVDIFSGKVTDWKEYGLKESLPIVVVHRSDGSGTTFLFTNYLSKVSQAWTFGADKAIEWPVGVGAKGNEGVAATVQNTLGAIGYVEFAYAKQNKMMMAWLENKSHKDIEPSMPSFMAAVKSIIWGNDYYTILTDTNDPEGYPIMGATFILIDKDKKDVALKVLKFLFFGWDSQYELTLDYVPLSTDDKVRVIKQLDDFQKSQ